MTNDELIQKWLNAFGDNADPAFLDEHVLSLGNLLWHIFSYERSCCLKEDDARAAFDGLEYDEAIRFESGYAGRIKNVSVTKRLTSRQLDDAKNDDIYIVAKDFSWTYVRTHERGMCGPFFRRAGYYDGIIIFGLNGAGKSTVGRALADRLGYKNMDIEDYYFDDCAIPYSNPRDRGDVILHMLADIRKNGPFVISAVDGELGVEITSMYKLAVYIEAPRDIRLERIKRRAYRRFGSRVLEGGDMYEREREFYEFAAARTSDRLDEWSKTLSCPIIRIDGTKPVEENIEFIAGEYSKRRG